MSSDAHAGMDHDASQDERLDEGCDCGCDCPPTHACQSSQVSALTASLVSTHGPALLQPDAVPGSLRPRAGTAPPLRPPAPSFIA